MSFNQIFRALCLFCAAVALNVTGAQAQDAQNGPPPADGPSIIVPGDAAVTGFPGTVDKDGSPQINLDGASVRIFDLSKRQRPRGQLITAPTRHQVAARDVGQVFGITLDNATPPNIYVAATSAYGLQIVGPDGKHTKTGLQGAQFMEGQFGPGGGPGSVWKIDGRTGEVTLFANLQSYGVPNSGAGLGNITFDPTHMQFFVSDLSSGLIHRLDINGKVIDSFDHGRMGLTAAGQQPVEFDKDNQMNINSPDFDAENSDTWGMADVRRRVWGLAYYKNRLYYAVAQGPQIWSVAINDDGSFGDDARAEVEMVPGGLPVSDMLFTPEGQLLVTQRGGMLGSADFSQFHTPPTNTVLRFTQDETGKWTGEPQKFSIGFLPFHHNSSGGIGLSCANILWTTGDALRNDPDLTEQLKLGGPLVVHGLQGNELSMSQPRNAPPSFAWFVDYDGQFDDPEKAGHVGDVAIYRDCLESYRIKNPGGGDDWVGGYGETWPGWTPGWTPPPQWVPPPWWPRSPDLAIHKNNTRCQYRNLSLILECEHTITVTNVGGGIYQGLLRVTDNPPGNGVLVPPPGGSIPWNCAIAGPGAPFTCTSAGVQTLLPGQSRTLVVKIAYPGFQNGSLRNCARVSDPGGRPFNNRDCGVGTFPFADLAIDKQLAFCLPNPAGGATCTFDLVIRNAGGAPFNGPIAILEQMPAGAVFNFLLGTTTPGWGCLPGVPGTIACQNPGPISLVGGAVEVVTVVMTIPQATFNAGAPIINCALINSADPNINGNNRSCAQVPPYADILPAVLPIRGIAPVCPAGFVPKPGGFVPPLNWNIQILQGGANPQLCEVKPKKVRLVCPRGWRRYPAINLAPPGWKTQVIRKGSRSLVCARPGPNTTDPTPPQPILPVLPPRCGANEQRFETRGQVPRGWSARRVTRSGQTIWCAKPRRVDPGPLCRPGEEAFASRRQIPSGWSRRAVRRNGRVIWCARPPVVLPGPQCRQGERAYQFRRQVPPGWQARRAVRNGRQIWCAVPPIVVPGPRCAPDERTYQFRRQVPPGWRARAVTRNGNRIWCARPPIVVPGPQCEPNERAYQFRRQVPPGWRARRVVRNRRVIWCAIPPIVRPPVCAKDERTFRNPNRVPRGWRVRVLRNAAGAVWCARPPVAGQICNEGERRYSSRRQVPPGWRVRVVRRHNRAYFCARPGNPDTGRICAPSERQFAARRQVPRGWRVRIVRRHNRAFFCARPGRPDTGRICQPGERQYTNRRQVPPGWRVRTVEDRNARIFFCARPGNPGAGRICAPGETRFANRGQVPRGWRVRNVRRNGRIYLCGRPGGHSVGPRCGNGETRFASRGRVPRGWRARRVVGGGRVIWCARPPRVVVCPPAQRLVRGKCVPIRVVCPPNQRLVRGRCVPNRIICPPRQRLVRGRCVPNQVICPPGQRLVRGRCVPNRVVCPPRQRLVRGRCVPHRVVCPQGQRLVRGRCVPNRVVCPPRQRLVRGRCVPNRVVCPPRQRLVRGRCVPNRVVCPPRQRLVRGRCVPNRIVCPPAMRLVRGRCVPRAAVNPRPRVITPRGQVCRRNERLIRGRCVRVR